MATTATKVKVVTTAAVLLLTLGGAATVAYRGTRSGSQIVALAPSVPGSTSIVPINEHWREGMNKTYTLKTGQILRRITPPYIADRTVFLQNIMRGNAPAAMISSAISSDSASLFEWDSSPEWKMEIYQPYTMGGLAQALAGLRSYDFEGMTQSLLYFRMPGDWIVQKSSTPQQRIMGLQAILNEEFAKRVQFVPRVVERAVIVVAGGLQIHTPPKAPFPDMVDIYLDQRVGQGQSMAAGKLDGLLGDVGELLGVKCLYQGTLPDKQFFWRNFLKEKEVRGSDRARELLLRNLSEQLNLEFRSERRPTEVWFVESSKGEQ